MTTLPALSPTEITRLLREASARHPLAEPIEQTLPDNTDELEALIQEVERRMAFLVRRFAGTEINADQWRVFMAEEILYLHRVAGILGHVYPVNMVAQDVRRIQQAVATENIYLDRWAAVLRGMRRTVLDADGHLTTALSTTFSEAAAAARANLYAQAARETYWRSRTNALGLPELPCYPGQRTQCGRNCRCAWQIQRLEGNGNWDCYWRRRPIDSCDTCKTRERTFAPLRIRVGEIQPFDMTGVYA